MMRAIWPILVLPVAVLPFGAQSGSAAETADFVTGTYSSKEGCDALAKHEEGQGDYLFLTSKGVSSYQLNCAFVSVFPRPGQPGAVAIAFCDEPGYSHPELISLKPSGQDSIDVNLPDSPYSGEGSEASGSDSDQQAPTDQGGTDGAARSTPDASASDQATPDQSTPDNSAPDQSTSETSTSDQAAPDTSSSGEGSGAPSTAEGMASGDDAAQSAGYVGLSGKYLRCQAPPG